jgi:L-asparaginase
LVVAGTGNGTLHHALQAALQQAQNQGVAVVRTTRCALGQVLARADGQGAGLAAWPLPAVKARVELMLRLRSAG